ncbi:MAG TPA: SDR family oxidoreductase [Mycobacteriales bacterium]|nr:SDR family oxidoreductase [Mycobacteriales bacterium]
MARHVALITGASSGIGAEFARQLAARGLDLVLVARDEARLSALAAELREEHGVTAEVMPADLVDDTQRRVVEQRLRAGVDFLVNNAGFGNHGDFVDLDIEAEDAEVRLNVLAVVRLTHAALAPMIDRGKGAVVNVSSVAGLVPGLPNPTYGASKAFVTSFSESLHEQMRPHGVRVMALCPGYTHTEFHARAGIDTSSSPDLLWLDVEDVVRAALKDLAAGRAVSVPGAVYKAITVLTRLAPRSLARRTAGRLRRGAMKV